MRPLKKKSSRQIPTDPTEYPSGVFIRTEKGYFYIASPSKRYYLPSKNNLLSWAPPRVIETTESAVRAYRVAAKMKFRNGSLLYSHADGNIYLVVSGKRCLIDKEVLAKINASVSDAIDVSPDELNLHELGRGIS